MSDCEHFHSCLLPEELSDSQLQELREHCRECQTCRELYELHEELAVWGDEVRSAELEDLEALRPEVLAKVSRQAGSSPRVAAGHSIRGPWFRGISAASAAAASLVVFVAGLAVGRSGVETPAQDAVDGIPAGLARAIHADAAANQSLPDVADSRFTYSNVSFRTLDQGRVALDFDVTTHVQLVESAESAVVRDVLVHALLDPSSTGARLKAMSYAGGRMESKVKDALIFTLHQDPSLAVRLKALTILADHLDDGDVEAAVLGALQDDESVQMRLLALDYLAAHDHDRSRIREVIEENQRPGAEALKVRLAEYGT
jgi:hypothetical protein